MTDPKRLDARALERSLRRPPAPAPALQAPDREAAATEARRRLAAAAWAQQIPPKLAGARLGDLVGVPGGEAVIEWARGEAWLDGVNLVLLGATGVGKTHAAVAACRPALAAGRTCRYWPTPDLLAALDWQDPDHRSTMRDAQVADLLVLDDVGSEEPNDWTRRKLYELIGSRWNADLPTILTTNLEPGDLEDALGPRSYSRVAGNGAVAVRLAGGDRRRTQPPPRRTP